MATSTRWDVDVAGPGTETTWDAGGTLWDVLPDFVSRTWHVIVRASTWSATVRASSWRATPRG